MNEKAALRKAIRRAHGGAQARAAESESICRHIIASRWYRDAQVVAGYVPLKWEADVTPVMQHALQAGKTLALPLCGEAPHMTLRRVTSLDELRPGAFGIPEPPEEAEIIPPEAVELLLIPLEGVAPDGTRLGKGGGYYDCLLARCGAFALGCALTWQRVAHIPADPWDRPLHAFVDADGVHAFINQK